jgi:hypothetical protein
MKLMGSTVEQEFRDELRRSHEFHFSTQPKSRLQLVLQQLGYKTDNAYVLHWTPDQSDDFYTVLIDGAFLVAVEIDRYEIDPKPTFRRFEMHEYLKGLSRMDQIRLLVAQDLLIKNT